MAARKPARGRKKKAAARRPKTASRKRKSAPARKSAARGKTTGRKAAGRGKTAKRSSPSRRKATRKVAKKKAVRRAAKLRLAAQAAVVPNGIGLDVQHMDYTSHAMDEVRRFYTETLGFSQFTLDGDYLHVQTGTSSSVGFMPPMPGPPDQWRPPREPALYFIVEDVDGAYRDLSARGVEFDQAPQDTFWGHRVAVLRDPEGRTVCLAQIIEK